jgi:hypothetical protein
MTTALNTMERRVLLGKMANQLKYEFSETYKKEAVSI